VRLTYMTSLFTVTSILSACATQPTDVEMTPFNARAEIASARSNAVRPQEPDDAPIQSPSVLTDDLLAITTAPPRKQRVDIEVTNRPAKQFFADLGKSMKLNILVDPEVTGNISLSLGNVTLDQVTSALRDLYGFDFKKTSYGYRVLPNQVSTQFYHLNYLNVQRSGTTQTSVGGNDSNSVQTDFSATDSSNSGFWYDIQQSVLGLIKNKEGIKQPVIINRQSGLMVVQATAQEHARIAQFLLDSELMMQKQVIIEAKVIEVTLDSQFSSGINWSFVTSNLGSTDITTSSGLSGDALTGPSGLGGVFNLNLAINKFSSMLELLDKQGDVQVLSSPRVSTVNNQKAVIKVGADEYFATVTSVSVDENGNVTPILEMKQFFSGIALDVTPQIGDDDNVTLHVHPSVSEVQEDTKAISLAGSNYSLPLAYSSIRESDSIIRAKSGQIVVIGGLLQQKKDINSAGLPGLNKLPVIRSLFAQDRQTQQKSELVILLKPTVYDERTTLDDLDEILERLN
jgi:MSHA biogenesis protein MshL